MMAKPSFSIFQLTRNEGRKRVLGLMSHLFGKTASKKVISILFFSIGKAARNTLLDKFSATQIATITFPTTLNQCGRTIVVKRNRTLDRFRFLSREQETKKSLQQVWNAVKGFDVKSEFEGQTNSFVYNIFFLNMLNKAVQERLCTERKGAPKEVLHFAVAFEEGFKRQTLYRKCSLEVDSEPISVSAITNTGKVCFGCGAPIFTQQHFPKCKAKEEKRENAKLRDSLADVVGESKLEGATPLKELRTQLA